MRFTTQIAASAVLALANAADLSGQATFYGGNVAGGACSFSTYTLPSGIFGTALSDSNWDTSANCGACVSVTGPSGNSITAMIVDECPGCGTNHLDLFPDAFAALANPTTGIIDVTWEYVACPITTPLEVHNKEGVSAYWFSMQVVNANQGVSSLEVSTDGGSTWKSTTRMTYNFFEQSSGFGTTTVDVKVTADNGDVVIINNVDVSSGASTTASSNFGTSGTSASTVAAVVASSSSPAVAEPTSSSSTMAEAGIKTTTSAVVASTTPGAVYQEVSSSLDATSKHTTLSSTTTLYKTITIPRSTSSSTSTLANTASSSTTSSSPLTTSSLIVANVTAAANATTALPSGYSISVLTISMCNPTVLTSVFPVSSSSLSTAIPVPTTSSAAATVSVNATIPVSTPTPSSVFTGSASSMQASIFLAVFAGFISFLI